MRREVTADYVDELRKCKPEELTNLHHSSQPTHRTTALILTERETINT
jgi:hypothetical protein